ncbi:hypothetical protein GGR57DRAFT_18166 [Xylariaceae sp. FL1272]|nr:hypothetical protein GGR57DRAFT_18166 [Xylariaceae sp. FL1272]
MPPDRRDSRILTLFFRVAAIKTAPAAAFRKSAARNSSVGVRSPARRRRLTRCRRHFVDEGLASRGRGEPTAPVPRSGIRSHTKVLLTTTCLASWHVCNCILKRCRQKYPQIDISLVLGSATLLRQALGSQSLGSDSVRSCRIDGAFIKQVLGLALEPISIRDIPTSSNGYAITLHNLTSMLNRFNVIMIGICRWTMPVILHVGNPFPENVIIVHFRNPIPQLRKVQVLSPN